ncbi:hypothetical protein BUALT_Bualt03G0191800 [Buddleja alternifolia]|uniref:Uncharacterized protein n=1 Tax=Buddleja alternifolia TaxID=168488 RepID=A0AAV6XVY4_9LAMI|nr:hypothetical protein BUALT_Bualt03G0191800 [Buddleja alternifolia]
MSNTFKILFALCLVTTLLLSQASAGGGVADAAAQWLVLTVRSGCRGTVAECLENDDAEFKLDSESNRCILATRRYAIMELLFTPRLPYMKSNAIIGFWNYFVELQLCGSMSSDEICGFLAFF